MSVRVRLEREVEKAFDCIWPVEVPRLLARSMFEALSRVQLLPARLCALAATLGFV